MVFHEPEGVEIWCLNQGHNSFTHEQMRRFTAWFQVHPFEEMEPRQKPEWGHIEWLQHCGIPVYMEEVQPNIPTSIRYPYEEVCWFFGGRYLTSAIAFMLAFAIYQRYEVIKLYGVDMDIGTDYHDQRPCVEFLMGVALGLGLKVWLPPGCPLLKGPVYAKTVMVPTTRINTLMRQVSDTADRLKRDHDAAVGACKAFKEMLRKDGIESASREPLRELLAEAEAQRMMLVAQYNLHLGATRACEALLNEALKGTREGTNSQQRKTFLQDALGYIDMPNISGSVYALGKGDELPGDAGKLHPENLPPIESHAKVEAIVEKHNKDFHVPVA